jgi:insertion element IS1 protein InsB
VEVEIYKVKEAEEAGVEESELDAPVELCGKQENPRWLWHAIERSSGQVLAYVLAEGKMKF